VHDLWRDVAEVSGPEDLASIACPDLQVAFCAHEDVVREVVVVEARGIGDSAVHAEDGDQSLCFFCAGEDSHRRFCAGDGDGFAFVGGDDVGTGFAEGLLYARHAGGLGDSHLGGRLCCRRAHCENWSFKLGLVEDTW
jgi:hypothetical protein